MKKAPEGASFLPDESALPCRPRRGRGERQGAPGQFPTRTTADTSACTERGVIPLQVDHHSLSRRKLT